MITCSVTPLPKMAKRYILSQRKRAVLKEYKGIGYGQIEFPPVMGRSNAHPAIPLSEKTGVQTPLTAARVIIDACRDLSWKKDWYPIARVSPELRKKILDKWQASLPNLKKTT